MRNEFTREQTLLQTLQVRYGGQFQKRYAHLSPEVMETVVRGAVMMLTDEQFNQGMARLYSSSYCPDIAEFQSWCVAGSWWTVEEAWQRACDYSNQSERELLAEKLKVTTLTKKAWDSVYWLVEQGSMKEAFKQFKSIYETYLTKAQMQGRQQEWYVPPKMIATAQPKGIAKNFNKKLSDKDQAICDLTQKFMSEGLGWKDAFNRAQVEVLGKPKPIFKTMNAGGAA